MQSRFLLLRSNLFNAVVKPNQNKLKAYSACFLAFFCACQLAPGAATLPTYDGINYSAGYDLGAQSDTNANTSIFIWTHIGIVAGRTRTVNVGSQNLIYA